jgi:hypothetical protein
MTDLDPEIWNNPTLGDAANNENLERLEKQQHEDRAARVEGREAREVIVERTYPDWTPQVQERTGTVPSNYQSVHFADENPNDIPVDSGRPDEDAGTVQDEENNGVYSDSNEEENLVVVEDAEEESSEAPEGSEVSDEAVTTESDSTEESDSTKWT